MDWWLRQRGVGVSADTTELGRASLPNRFLAIVPRADAEILSAQVREAAQAAWKAAAKDVQAKLRQKYDAEFPGWDRLWDAQIDSYFDFRTTWLGLAETDNPQFCDAAADANAKQAGLLADEEFARYARPGQWQRAVELSSALMRASGHIRHIPNYEPAGDAAQKCTIFGTYEQMGPARLANSRRFWAVESAKGKEDSDRRCAVALVKKHAFAWHLQPKLGFDPAVARFEEMNEIAGGENGYYAMLAMDGDDMGMWLSGEKSPKVREILHPEILAWYEGQAARCAGLDARRPVSPSLHASISAALTKFAVKVAPGIVEEHGGKLIYSGGDDLLAALPLERALSCALALRNQFRSVEVMGSRAGMSAGLAVAHTKEDLRYVLAAARRAEREAKREAKREGKDRLTLAVLRRSGEHAFAGCAWDYVGAIERQVERFRQGASDSWTYQIRRQLDVLMGLDEAAFEAELGRLIQHGEKPDLDFLEDFRRFRTLCGKVDPREAFVGLCQSAAFLARGKEER
jgi:CRISPR-associated protein Cmr2